MSRATTILDIAAALLAVLAFYFFGRPWIKPLYQRYLSFVERKASGK